MLLVFANLLLYCKFKNALLVSKHNAFLPNLDNMVKITFPYFPAQPTAMHTWCRKDCFLPSTHYLNLASSSTLAGFCASCLRLGISGVAFRGVLGVPGKGCKEKLQPHIDFLQTAISIGEWSFIQVSQTLLRDATLEDEQRNNLYKGNYKQAS